MKDLVALTILAALFFLVTWTALSIPVVKWSWTTKECISVSPPEAGTCDQPPERHERVWVR